MNTSLKAQTTKEKIDKVHENRKNVCKIKNTIDRGKMVKKIIKYMNRKN